MKYLALIFWMVCTLIIISLMFPGFLMSSFGVIGEWMRIPNKILTS